jgi:hypothetical protein
VSRSAIRAFARAALAALLIAFGELGVFRQRGYSAIASILETAGAK